MNVMYEVSTIFARRDDERRRRIADAQADYRAILFRLTTPEPEDARRLVEVLDTLALDFGDAQADAKALERIAALERQAQAEAEAARPFAEQAKALDAEIERHGRERYPDRIEVVRARQNELYSAAQDHEIVARNLHEQQQRIRAGCERLFANTFPMRMMLDHKASMG